MIIGAMLVAPLMLAILGLGLGVVQGNLRLLLTQLDPFAPPTFTPTPAPTLTPTPMAAIVPGTGGRGLSLR